MENLHVKFLMPNLEGVDWNAKCDKGEPQHLDLEKRHE